MIKILRIIFVGINVVLGIINIVKVRKKYNEELAPYYASIELAETEEERRSYLNPIFNIQDEMMAHEISEVVFRLLLIGTFWFMTWLIKLVINLFV